MKWKGCGRKLSWPNRDTVVILDWSGREGSRNFWVSISGVLDKVRTEHFPITSLKRYCNIAAQCIIRYCNWYISRCVTYWCHMWRTGKLRVILRIFWYEMRYASLYPYWFGAWRYLSWSKRPLLCIDNKTDEWSRRGKCFWATGEYLRLIADITHTEYLN